nr:MAG TPA: hypothetical protein [Caudoviricetes sp.]
MVGNMGWMFSVWKSLTGVKQFLRVKFDTLCYNKVKIGLDK